MPPQRETARGVAQACLCELKSKAQRQPWFRKLQIRKAIEHGGGAGEDLSQLYFVF